MSATVLDRNGAALQPGDRVRFRDTYYYLNLCDGSGTVRTIDQYGGIAIDTDQPMQKADRDGFLHLTSCWYFCSGYDHERQARVAARTVGDPHEHGSHAVWVEKLPAPAAAEKGAER